MRKEESRIAGAIAVGIMILVAIFTPITCHSKIVENTPQEAPAGWSEDLRLTTNNYADYKAKIAVEDNAIHIVWARYIDPNWRVYYINSTDEGMIWNQEMELAQPRTNPDISVSGQNVSVVYDSGLNIYYRSSPDGGQSWLPEKMISTIYGFNSEAPIIAVSEDGMSIHVVWVDSRHSSTEVYYKRSTDGGITWDDALGNPGQDRRITHELSGAFPLGIGVNNSNIHVLFGDDRDSSFDVYYIRSTDNGVTWDDGQMNIDLERKLTTNATKHGPGRLAVHESTIHVIWVDYINPNYWLYYCNSTDNGFSWSSPELLTGPTQMIASPAIAVEGSDVNIVWDDSRDGEIFKPEIYFKNSTDGGISWGSDLRLTYNLTGASQWPRISVANGVKHIAWYDDRNGGTPLDYEIYYKRHPDFPVVDTAPPEIRHDTIVSANIGHPINITANVTDDVAVAAVFLNYTGVNATNYNVSMNRWGDNFSYDIPGQDNIGIVEYFIWANDMSDNTNQSMNYTVQILDISSPVILHTPLASAPLDTSIIILANVTDDVEVANVTLYYQNVGDTAYTSVDMVFVSGNWVYEIPAQNKTGTVHYFIWANDTSGNNATSPIMGDYSIRITGPPGIVIANPKGGERWTGGSEQRIEFIASDTEDSLADLTVFLNYTSGAEIVYITQIKGNESSYPWTLPKINASDVKINATVIDSDGNKAYADSPMFTIDSTMPRIISTNPTNNTTGISIHQPIVIQFSEPMNISSVVVNQTNGTDPGGWQWFWNADRDTITGIHDSWLTGDIIEITVQENYSDGSNPGNTNNTAYIFTFTTETNPPPEIVHVNISEPQELSDAIRINATITDDGTVMNAVLWWRDVDGNWRESYMQKDGVDWFYIMPGQMTEGRVRYQINATDDLGQRNSTAIYEFDVVDSTPPVITHAPIANAVIGGPINITCLVADLGGVDVVYLHYRNESEVNFTWVMMSPGYWLEIPAYSLPVTIEYYIQAFDIYGNEASTEIYILEIIDPTVPDTTPPGILFVEPTGNNIQITASISIVFTEAVDRASVENAITITPAVSGITYTWLNDQTLIVSFNALRYNMTYTISIGTGAADLAGNAMASDYSWEFTTEMEPEIVQQPVPNNWGWIGIIMVLVAIIMAMIFYRFNMGKKEEEPEDEINNVERLL